MKPTKCSKTAQLEARIAQIESRMAKEWRFFRQYSVALVRAKLLLQIQINNQTALLRKKARERQKQVFRYFEERIARLRETNYFAYLRIYRPRAYDWGITDEETILAT